MRALAAAAIAVLAGCEVIVDPPHLVHPEVLVNSITPGSQANVAVAYANERYFVVWQDSSATPPDTEKKAIRGRFVSKTGVPQAADSLINATTPGSQDHPQVAAIGNSLLVVWQDDSSGVYDVKGRLLSTQGDFLTGELAINTTIDGVQEAAQILATPASTFLVVWADQSLAAPDTDLRAIRGRRFDATGMAVDASDFVLNSTTIGDQYEPALARGADGHILVLWTDVQTGEGGDIRGRLLDGNATPLAADFRINTTVDGVQQQPYAIGLAGGGYLVAWTDGSSADTDVDGLAVRARLLDANGAGLGNDFVLNARTTGDQAHPRLVQLPDASIFLSFEDGSLLPPDHDGNGVRVRRLAADGTPQGDERQANTFFPADQEDTALAVDPDGNVLVLWEDGGSSPPDDSSDSVRARLYPPGS